MKLSEKIVELRKANGMTQEELANICNVSRQSISKWEADIALPEMDKLLLIGDTFHVSMDVLLKDELVLNQVKKNNSCGVNSIHNVEHMMYKGALIKESIRDDSIIDLLNVHKIELWNTGGNPKYWTVLFFSSNVMNLPEKFSSVMLDESDCGVNWFVDFKTGNEKYVVFKNKILKYHIGNLTEKEEVCLECRKLGIIDSQMNWSE